MTSPITICKSFLLFSLYFFSFFQENLAFSGPILHSKIGKQSLPIQRSQSNQEANRDSILRIQAQRGEGKGEQEISCSWAGRRNFVTTTSKNLLATIVLPSLLLNRQQQKNEKEQKLNRFLNFNIANVNAAEVKEGELTEEFLSLDKKKREFRAKQLEIRKDWDEEMAVFMTLRDEKSIIKKMEKLVNIIRVAEGLPLGVTKKDMVSKMRTVKRAGKQDGFWTTDVEKAYQSYIRAVDYVQSPNTDRQI